jgi:hypothetical protein
LAHCRKACRELAHQCLTRRNERRHGR